MKFLFDFLLLVADAALDAVLKRPSRAKRPVRRRVTRRRAKKVRNGAKALKRYLKSDRLCAKCDSRYDLTIHHVKPVCEGGDNAPHNLEVLCVTCHRSWNQLVDTGKKHWTDFREWVKVKWWGGDRNDR